MKPIMISPFTEAVLAYAREQVAESRGQLTMESFLAALLSVVDVAAISDFREEAKATRKLLKENFPERTLAIQRMQEYLEQEHATLMHGKVSFRHLMRAIATRGETVTTEILLAEILSCPSKAVEEALKEQQAIRIEQVSSDSFEEILAGDKLSDLKIPEEDVETDPTVADPKQAVDELVGDIKDIRKKLLAEVFGQDNAVQTFLSGYFQAKMLAMIDSDRSRPLASYLFAGPPGVGKTFLAESIAESLKLPFKRFDMSEYADKEAHLEMCGFDQSYRGAKKGNLTGFLAENPKCVLLFDEIEKAHIVVIHLFLQMLDAGCLRDNFTDEEVSFSDAIVIMTTNAGKQLYEASETEDLSVLSRKTVIRALQKDIDPTTNAPFFPAAICSRFASGNVVMFNHMTAHHLCNVARKKIDEQAENLLKGTGWELCCDERLTAALLFSEGGSADARVIKSRTETFLTNELYELMRMVESQKTKSGIADLKTIDIRAELEQADPAIQALFTPQDRVDVLVVTDEETSALCRQKVPTLGWYAVSDFEEALSVLKTQPISLVLLDMNEGVTEESRGHLNLEDADSVSRRLMVHLQETQASMPMYVLCANGETLDEEETVSFMRRGMRGVIDVSRPDAELAAEMNEIVRDIYRQQGIVALTRQNKLLSFETSQLLSEDGTRAMIRLYDFKLTTAVDSEDAENVLSALSMPEDTFDDVIGADEVKKELSYFVNYLKEPKRYAETGVKAPKGVLMYGPPGTGKTMLARAMAHEAGVAFLAVEGNMFLKKRLGEGAELVHRIFRTARKYAPAVLFVDEIDTIARDRMTAGSADEAVLTAFLTEMDGFRADPSRPVFVLAATNFDVTPGHARSLDGALLRRFDRRILVDLPDRAARKRFLEKKCDKTAALQLSKALIESIALRSTGMSLASLDSVAELSLRSAIRANSATVTDEIFEEAFENFNNGEKKPWDASLLERVARHEAGHALLCWLSGETPSYLTVAARDGHGGYMQHAEREGRPLYTKRELLARIRTALGGRAAEWVCYGCEDGLSTGAGGDLQTATALARELVCCYGMSDAVGLAVIDRAEESALPEIRRAINALLREQLQAAIELVEANRDKLDRLTEALIVGTHLTGVQVEEILS